MDFSATFFYDLSTQNNVIQSGKKIAYSSHNAKMGTLLRHNFSLAPVFSAYFYLIAWGQREGRRSDSFGGAEAAEVLANNEWKWANNKVVATFSVRRANALITRMYVRRTLLVLLSQLFTRGIHCYHPSLLLMASIHVLRYMYSCADCMQQKANNQRTKNRRLWNWLHLAYGSGSSSLVLRLAAWSAHMSTLDIILKTDKEEKMPFVTKQMNVECHSECSRNEFRFCWPQVFARHSCFKWTFFELVLLRRWQRSTQVEVELGLLEVRVRYLYQQNA